MIYLCKLNMYMQIENYRSNMGRNTSYTYDSYLEYTEYIYVSFVHIYICILINFFRFIENKNTYMKPCVSEHLYSRCVVKMLEANLIMKCVIILFRCLASFVLTCDDLKIVSNVNKTQHKGQ